MIHRRSERGVSLTEMLIGMVVMAVVAAAALTLLNSQQRAFKDTASDRALQDSARVAVAELATSLRRAGYGVDPWLAFDFGPQTAAPATNQSYESGRPGGTRVACSGGGEVTCRDSVTGSDEIVFYSRDPAFMRQLSGAPTSTSLAFSTPLKGALLAGQVLQVMCGGAGDRAYVTVAATAADLRSVTLASTASGPFPFQQSRISGGCFTQNWATARVFKVDRFHYFVSTYTDPDHPSGRPWLMLDQGLSTTSGTPVVEPVAPDVEDVQFGYVFLSGDVVGRTAGTQLASAATSIDLGIAPPEYEAATTDASRLTHNPANIRAVVVSAVVRTSAFDLRLTGTADRTIAAAANRAANTAGPAGYRRLLVETTAATRNLDSRGAFMPPYSVNGGVDGLNVGGG